MNEVFSAGDFSGDGFPDVFARNASGQLFMYPRDGAGGWLPRTMIGTGWNVFRTIIPVGDFNGDGFADVMGDAAQRRALSVQRQRPRWMEEPVPDRHRLARVRLDHRRG